ncbi:MAG: FAD-binding oxidoreductase [Chloroflexota bacterium]
MTHKTEEIVIIGGGISGTAAAYELAQSGAQVTLIEKGSLASMASGWTLAGVRQSGRHPAELPLAQAAVKRWQNLNDELEADVSYRQEGNLRLAFTPDEVDFIANMVEEQRALGLQLDFLPDGEAVREVAPALSDTVLAASFCPSDGHANPTATVQAFAAAAERHGAKIMTETAVTDIEINKGQVSGVLTTAGRIAADIIIMAAGIYTGKLCEKIGLRLPIEVKHVSALQTVSLPPMLNQVLGVASADFACRQQVDGRFRMTPGAEAWEWPAGPVKAEDVYPPMSRISMLIDRACRVIPALKEARLNRTWGGLLDMTPDGLPVIERIEAVDGLVIAGGFSGHGFCLGPITGQIISDLVLHGESALPLEPFKLNRFADFEITGEAELLG